MEHETQWNPELNPVEAPEHTPEAAEAAEEAAEAVEETAEAAEETAREISAPAEAGIPASADEADAQAEPARTLVCDVQFRTGSKLYFFDPGELKLKTGDHVIIDTARGVEYGTCVIGNHRILSREIIQPLRRVIRIATPADERTYEENVRKEKAAFAFCQKKVAELGLDMQLASAECAFDGSKLLFFFTADERVDFRELVKILASAYHTRIELRQIGVRDKARMFGGLGICGRPFCCSSFLGDFEPVSIKMAKTQNLSLNPTKISGTCGRLMCCLKYEQEAYEDLIKSSPKPESFVDTPEGRGTVTAVDLMHQSVSVRMEKDPDEIHSFKNSEILVLRNGKARKNDPQIPDDLAPISGSKDPMARISRVEQRLVLEAEEAELEAIPEPEAELPAQPADERQPAHSSEASGKRHADRGRTPRTPAKQETAESRPAETQEGQKPSRRGGQNRRRHSDHRGGKGRNPDGAKSAQQAQKPVLPAAKPIVGDQKLNRDQKPGRDQKPNREPKPNRDQRPKRDAAERTAAESHSKNANRRRYYHNRKPKQG